MDSWTHGLMASASGAIVSVVLDLVNRLFLSLAPSFFTKQYVYYRRLFTSSHCLNSTSVKRGSYIYAISKEGEGVH